MKVIENNANQLIVRSVPIPAISLLLGGFILLSALFVHRNNAIGRRVAL